MDSAYANMPATFYFEWWDSGAIVKQSVPIPEHDLDRKRVEGAKLWLIKTTRSIVVKRLNSPLSVQTIYKGEALLTLDQEKRLFLALALTLKRPPQWDETSMAKQALAGSSDDIADFWLRDALTRYLNIPAGIIPRFD